MDRQDSGKGGGAEMDRLDHLPDFLIIGVMKSGSTTLHRWLSEHPDVWFPRKKEPGFFSHDRNWDRGLDWYRELFSAIPPGRKTGEASMAYTKPPTAEVSARRIAHTLPSVKMVAILREPVERIRSHYRHEIQMGRENRPLLKALRDPKTQYLAQSHYHRVLAPYLQLFTSDQLLIIRIDDLIADDEATWHAVLDHFELERRPRPVGAYNVTASKPRSSKTFRRLSDRGLVRRLDLVPRRIRRAMRPWFLADPDDPSYQRQLEGSKVPIPGELLTSMWRDVGRLEGVLGRELWLPNGESQG